MSDELDPTNGANDPVKNLQGAVKGLIFAGVAVGASHIPQEFMPQAAAQMLTASIFGALRNFFKKKGWWPAWL